MKKTKAELLVLEDEYNALSWEQEVLEQRYELVVKEKDDLYEQFSTSVYDVQQKTGFKNLLLEKKLQSMDLVMEQKEAQLNEVLVHAQLAPSVLGQVKGRLDDVLEVKNQSQRDLSMELEHVQEQHRRLVQAVQEKLIQHGIPEQELGFVPAVTVE